MSSTSKRGIFQISQNSNCYLSWTTTIDWCLKSENHDLFEKNYTRNEWKRCENTLETSGEDVNTTLETSVFNVSPPRASRISPSNCSLKITPPSSVLASFLIWFFSKQFCKNSASTIEILFSRANPRSKRSFRGIWKIKPKLNFFQKGWKVQLVEKNVSTKLKV